MENTFDLKKFLVENELTRNSRSLKEEQELSPEEQKIVDDILSGLNEGTFDDVLQKVKSYAKKGVLTATMITALLASPNLTQAQKQSIKNAVPTSITAPSRSVKAVSTPIIGSVKSISFAESFASGKATLTNRDSLVNSINEIKTWMVGKKIVNFKVIITAGESQVTNPEGKYRKEGALATARAKAVENEIKGLGFKTINIQTKIGTTPYEKGNDINDPDYQKEQFVTVDIVVDNSICGISPANANGAQGTKLNGYITYNEYMSGKGNIIFSTGQVPDRLVILDINGNIKEDTGYITTEISKYKDWKFTPLYVLELTKVYKANSKAVAGSKIKTITVKDSKDLRRQLLNNPNSITYQKLGKEIAPALEEMDQMIAKGQNEFVIYDLGTKDAIVNFDQSKGEVQTIVYSPIGKTDFGVEGNCTR